MSDSATMDQPITAPAAEAAPAAEVALDVKTAPSNSSIVPPLNLPKTDETKEDGVAFMQIAGATDGAAAEDTTGILPEEYEHSVFFQKHFRQQVDDVKSFMMRPIPKELGQIDCSMTNHMHVTAFTHYQTWELHISDSRVRYIGDAFHTNFSLTKTNADSAKEKKKKRQPRRRLSMSDLMQNRCVMVSRSKLESNQTVFAISLADCNDLHPKLETDESSFLGIVRAENFRGTTFSGFSGGKYVAVIKNKSESLMRKETIHMSFERLKDTQFRRTQVVMPRPDTVDTFRDPGGNKSLLSESMEGTSSTRTVVKLSNRPPHVDASSRRASLDVGGLLVEDWDYNLQLDVVEEEDAGLPPAVQLYRVEGKGSKHHFSLKARYPLSLYQAFQIALSTMENAKLEK